MENKNEFWADVSAIAVCPVAIAAGFAKGAYNASTDNGAFVDGFSAAATPIIRAARGFGEEHGTTITKGVVTGAAGTLGAHICVKGSSASQVSLAATTAKQRRAPPRVKTVPPQVKGA